MKHENITCPSCQKRNKMAYMGETTIARQTLLFYNCPACKTTLTKKAEPIRQAKPINKET